MITCLNKHLPSLSPFLPIHCSRVCVGSLQKLPLPDKAIDMTRTLAVNVRTLCVDTLFHRAARGTH